MSHMSAYRLVEWGRAELTQVEVPEPGPGELLLAVGGAGLCRTDLDLMQAPEGQFSFAPPFTLGHETAGWVAACGPQTDAEEGAGVLVSCVHSCGKCEFCARGSDNYCWEAAPLITRGIGLDGGLAEYVVVPERETVELRALAPRDAAPLADAGVTSYHAVTRNLDVLAPGATAVVYGVGGLGFFAVQLLRELTSARIVAVDPIERRRAAAVGAGAEIALAPDEDLRAKLEELTDGRGAHAQFDFVGSDATLGVAAASSRPRGRIVLCGMEGGTLPLGWFRVAPGCEVSISQGGTLGDLREVVALAEADKLQIDVETYELDQVEVAYQRLREGALDGRAVVTPIPAT